MNCPEVSANGATYSIVVERQLPNDQPSGMVVAVAGGAATMIPWGAHVTLGVDTFARSAQSTSFGCGKDAVTVTFANVAIITSP